MEMLRQPSEYVQNAPEIHIPETAYHHVDARFDKVTSYKPRSQTHMVHRPTRGSALDVGYENAFRTPCSGSQCKALQILALPGDAKVRTISFQIRFQSQNLPNPMARRACTGLRGMVCVCANNGNLHEGAFRNGCL